MQRCVIIGGADIRDYERLKQNLRADDFVIYCDSGLKHKTAFSREADLIIGDFDSFDIHAVEEGTERIVLPCEKDDTDTFYAVKEALKRGYRDFLLFGVLGGRMDHSLGNLSILSFLHEKNASGKIFDDYSEIVLIRGGERILIEDCYAFFSLIAYDGPAVGVSIKGAKYPLEKATINGQYQYGISNEVLPLQVAEISLQEGQLLVIKDFEKNS